MTQTEADIIRNQRREAMPFNEVCYTTQPNEIGKRQDRMALSSGYPKRWDRRTNPSSCIACQNIFMSGQMIYDHGSAALHVECLPRYVNYLLNLGLIVMPKDQS